MSPAPDWQTSLNSAVAGVNMQVTPENVLAVRKVLLQEAEELLQFTGSANFSSQMVGLCGGDPVSQQASKAFTQRITILMTQCAEYAKQLLQAGNSLGDIAKNYGYTEEQIEASFSSLRQGAQA